MRTISLRGYVFWKSSSDLVLNVWKPGCNISSEMWSDDFYMKIVVMRFMSKKKVGMDRLRGPQLNERYRDGQYDLPPQPHV